MKNLIPEKRKENILTKQPWFNHDWIKLKILENRQKKKTMRELVKTVNKSLKRFRCLAVNFEKQSKKSPNWVLNLSIPCFQLTWKLWHKLDIRLIKWNHENDAVEISTQWPLIHLVFGRSHPEVFPEKLWSEKFFTEKVCGLQLYPKRNPDTGVFLEILRKFLDARFV